MDFVSPILDVARCLWDCVAKPVVYIHHLPENLSSLRTAMKELNNMYNDIKERVEREERLQKRRTHVVDGWIQTVQAMEKEVNELLAEGDEEIQKKCLGTCCPKNCRASYKFAKKVREKMDAVVELRSKANLSPVAEPTLPSSVIERPLDKTVGLDSLCDKVWRHLQDDKVGSIGLYGMGGVGKTTLLNRINNEFLKTRVEFDVVIWVTVSRPAHVEKVQRVLFNKLEVPNYKWEGRSEDERAEEIFNVLKTKKFVLLLDDMWEHLDLLKVGIPPLNEQNKSKVIFTTRFSNVCRDMGAKKSIKVECLAWEEAFSLFQMKVGEDTINSHPDIPKLAEIVAKDCHGLPLALVTIGRAMSGTKTPEEWEKKIQILRNYPAKFPGMKNDLFPGLAFSYDSLCDDTTKSCFLYCSLFPRDHGIDCEKLVELWIGEGLLDKYSDIKEAKNRGEEIIERLKHAGLLESADTDWWTGGTYVKMHDVIHDTALWLACESGKKENKFVVKDKVELIEAHQVAKWKEAERISLWGGGIEELMELPSFPHVETLFACGSYHFKWTKSFPGGFFTYMPFIRVLNLSNNDKLIELPREVGKLITLQYLNLSNTRIKELPVDVRNLKSLRCLTLDEMASLERVPSQLISGLSSLELFNIFKCRATLGDCRALLEELEGLKSMEEISITLDTVLSTQTLLDSHKLQKCVRRLSLKVCNDMNSLHLLFPCLEKFEALLCSNLIDMKVDLEKEAVHSKVPRHQHLHHLCHVRIECCLKLLNLTCLIYAPNLKFLWVSDCHSMEELIDVKNDGVSEIEPCSGLFSRLTHLCLWSLPKLWRICGWNLSFPSLKLMHVIRCPDLRYLPFDLNFGMNKILEEIKGEQKWWAELEWEDSTILRNLTPYFVPHVGAVIPKYL